MTVVLVRHGHAEKRKEWSRSDFLRPLTARGERQGHGLIEALDGVSFAQILSSPTVRCRETVESLATARGLSVEVDSRLGEDARGEQVQRLLRERSDVPTLICAGRKPILELLSALGVGNQDEGRLRCQKGSAWVLEGRGLRVDGAEYLAPRERGPERAPSRLAVLDIGSTSFSLLVADATADRAIESILRERSVLRLGAHCGPEGVIPEQDFRRALDAVRLMRDEADSVDCDVLLAVGTAVLRDTVNGPELAERIGQELGQPVRVLTGEQEARLAYAAVQVRLGAPDAAMLAMDLGGGSLELAAGVGVQCSWARSFPLGVTRLAAELVQSEGLSGAEQVAIGDRVRSFLGPHARELERFGPIRLAATGGSVRALARLASALRAEEADPGVNGRVFSRGELERLFVKLRRSTREARLGMPTVQSRRVELLPTGALILCTLMKVLNVAEVVVCDWGLREGIVLERLQADARDPSEAELRLGSSPGPG